MQVYVPAQAHPQACAQPSLSKKTSSTNLPWALLKSCTCMSIIEKEKKRKVTPLGVITGASRPRGSLSINERMLAWKSLAEATYLDEPGGGHTHARAFLKTKTSYMGRHMDSWCRLMTRVVHVGLEFKGWMQRVTQTREELLLLFLIRTEEESKIAGSMHAPPYALLMGFSCRHFLCGLPM